MSVGRAVFGDPDAVIMGGAKPPRHGPKSALRNMERH